MSAPILSAIIIIFILWLQYEIRKTSRNSEKESDLFWQREREANTTRKVDISDLNYIQLSLEKLPMEDSEDQTLNSYRDTIIKLSQKKILNLTGLTNTELKSRYGAANFNALTEYDNNYIMLVSILHKWAERLYNNGNLADCRLVLEFALTIPTDVMKSYLLLASVYMEQNEADTLDELIHRISDTTIADKDKLIEELNAMKNP